MRRFLRRLDDVLLALSAVALADLVLFHAGVYFPLVQPESHSGEVMAQERRLARSVEAHPGRGRIVVMGDSIAAASVQEAQLEAELAAAGLPYRVVNMAIASTTPRAWLPLLSNGGVSADNTAIVILGLDASSIQVPSGDASARDLEIAKTHLKIRDALTLAATYPGFEMRLTALSSAVFRTPLYREDLKQALENPPRRRRQLAALAREEARGERRENRSRHDLTSARLGDDGRLVAGELAPFLKQRDRLRRGVERRLQRRRRFLAAGGVTPPAAIDPGKRRTIGRLVERLNARGIRVVLMAVPRSPYPLGELDAAPIEALHRGLRRSGADVALWLDPGLIRRLETPEHYRELVHVNARGARLYTRALARFLATTLAADGAVH